MGGAVTFLCAVAMGGAVVMGGAVAGCAIATNLATSGYALESSVCDASNDATCSAPVTVLCASGAECGGEICCLTLSLGSPTSPPSCQEGPSCSGSMGAQLCLDAADCDGGPCITQLCSFSSPPTLIHTCGIGSGLSTFCDASM
ncbi:MAG TPA: hypothetical protein VEK07_10115 [Polyangiaceae bacterium]|nr:hypothetical protein [Polyangiaceae bacterium]